MSDTIAAIATARGRAALAIVRLSGPEAIPIAASCFRGADLEAAASHTAHVGFITADEGPHIDQVVVTLFRAPRSVTGEDVVEISCHGGDYASQLILQRLIGAGARLAEPGEFTQRSFLNGKMDLAQAEAVAELIHASSSLAHQVSLHHVQGRYSERLDSLRSEMLDLCAYVELELDFSEEDVEFADRERLAAFLAGAESLLQELLGSYHLGSLIRDGVRVVIGGRPNAGKSTLLNALVGRDRAIVSPTPGTTRDEIEAEAEIGGLQFRFVDTAGLREATDAIEAEGVRRARHSIDTADLVLYVYDLTLGLDDQERLDLAALQEARPGLPILIVGNKLDLVLKPDKAGVGGQAHLSLSAEHAMRDTTQLDPLLDAMLDDVAGSLRDAEASPIVTNQRHRQHLDRAYHSVRAARAALENNATGDTLALDLRAALHEIGQITGAITNEDVLGQIFSRFCIGK